MLLADPGYVSPVDRMRYISLVDGLSEEGRKKRLSKKEADLAAAVLLFPLYALKFVGAEFVHKAAKVGLSKLLRKIPKGIAEHILITFGKFSPMIVFTMWHYGYFESFWSGVTKFVAIFV